MNATNPFPSHLELINEIAVALNVRKPIEKELSSVSGLSLVDMKYLLEQVLIPAITKSASPEVANIVHTVVLEYFREYAELVRDENADGVSREEVEKLLAEYLLPEFWNELLFQVAKYSSLPGKVLIEMCQPSNSSLQLASAWIGTKLPKSVDWREHCRTKLQHYDGQAGLFKYHLQSYAKHADQSVPGQATIDRIFPIPGIAKHEQRLFRSALTLARVIDYTKRTEIGKASLGLATNSGGLGNTTPMFKAFRNALADERRAKIIARAQLEITYDKLDRALALDTSKAENAKEEARALLAYAKYTHSKSHSEHHPIADKTLFYWARYYVLSGDLESAVKSYGQAFDQALYCDGPLTHQIIQEGYRVAARHNAKGSMALLRKLKKAATLLMLDGTANLAKFAFTNKSDEIIAGWEIEQWAAEFNGIFNPLAMFIIAKHNQTELRPWFLEHNNNASKQVDMRSPNAKVKSGVGITKTTPKLIYCIEKNDTEGFKKLIQKGACVNKQDSFGATALIKSLTLVRPEIKSNNLFFDTLIQMPHSIDALNAYCTNSCSTALSGAIDSASVNNVNQVLRLAKEAADPNQLEEQLQALVNQKGAYNLHYAIPPLFYILERIGDIKHIDALTSYQQKTARSYNLTDLRTMANLLLRNGAKPEHQQSPQFEPTPFWLAILLDESEILACMLHHGAEPTASYHDPNHVRSYSALDFASLQGSKECEQLLKCETS